MRAFAFDTALYQSSSTQLYAVKVPTPQPTGHDLLVEVHAVSVNPVDLKIRAGVQPSPGEQRILGFDAAGVVVAVGESCTLFQPGDAVYYAGEMQRPGSNAEFQLVDERIVARKPQSLSFAEAASLPLTALTAYEMLFDRLQIQQRSQHNDQLLIIGAAGGVGSMAVQLAKRLTDLQIIATASRPESQAWCLELGAHMIVDHTPAFSETWISQSLVKPNFVFCTTHSETYAPQLPALMAPQGHLGLIDDPEIFDIIPFKQKSISIHWEFMFTRTMYTTPDIQRQQTILAEVAALVDEGKIRHTTTRIIDGFHEAAFAQAYSLLSQGHHHGKIVIHFKH